MSDNNNEEKNEEEKTNEFPKKSFINSVKNGLMKFLGKVKSIWLKFVSRLKRTFGSTKDVHTFRKRLVLGIVFGILAIAIILIVIFGIGLYKYNWNNRPAQIADSIFPYPAAFVGTNTVSLKDYNKRIQSLQHYYSQLNQKPDAGYKKSVLDGIIDHVIYERVAKKYGIFVTNKEVEDQYQQLIAGEGGEDQVKKILSELWGYDIPYFKDLIKQKLLEEKVQQEVPVSLHLKHLLLKVDPSADFATKTTVLRQIQVYLTDIKNGKKFADEIKQFSEDTATNNSGGDLGTLYLDQIQSSLGKDCDNKLTNAKVGDYVICQSPNGYELINVSDKSGKVNQGFTSWFNDVKSKTKIWRLISTK